MACFLFAPVRVTAARCVVFALVVPFLLSLARNLLDLGVTALVRLVYFDLITFEKQSLH